MIYTTQFKKDFKRVIRQGKDESVLRDVVDKLQKGEKLLAKHKDHKLSGRLKNYRECHLAPNWLLLYQTDKKTLTLERTGSHSDLFQ